MSLSPALCSYLHKNRIHYDVLEHASSKTAMDTAGASRLNPDRVAKAVIVRHASYFTMCVIPASHQLILEWLEYELQLPFEIATERELMALFPDCTRGAIPGLGQAYNMNVVIDTALMNKDDIYIEGGDHQHLVHINCNEFRGLMDDAWQAVISCPVMNEFEDMLH